MRKKSQISIATLVVMVVAGSTLYGCSISSTANSNTKGKGQRFQMPVVVQKVTKSDIGGGEVFSGAITPSSLTNLASKINGKVTALNVNVGDHVKKGQALATIDTSSLQQSLEQAQSSANVSQANYNKATDDQANALLSAELAAQLQSAQATKTLNDSQSSVSSAKQSLAVAQAQINKALHDQQMSVASAKQAVASAQVSLDKARSDAATAVTNAQAAVDAAQTALQNAQAGASTNLSTLQQNVQQAQSAYQSALAQAGNDPTNPGVQSAYAKLQSALSALQAAQGTPSSVQSAQSQLNQAQATLTSALNSQSVQVAQQQYNQAVLNLAAAQNTSQDVLAQQLTQAQIALTNAQLSAQGTAQTTQAQLAQSQQSVKTADSTDALKVSQAALAQSLTNVKVISEQLQDGVLVSPVDGIVTAINAPVGQQAGSSVVSVAATDPMQATVNVPESEISKVKVGTAMDVNVPTLGKTFKGTVLAIHPTLDATTKSYGVDIKVDDADHVLLPGMFAEATLKSAGRQAIMVPADTVLSESSGNFVYVDQNNRAHKVQVQIGVMTSSQYEITSGLNEGDQLVVKGEELLSDSVPVQEVSDAQYARASAFGFGGNGNGSGGGGGRSGSSGGGNGGGGYSGGGNGGYSGGGNGSSSKGGGGN